MATTKPKRIRLDELLTQRGLARSRSEAQALILAGKVRTGTTILDKPGKEFTENLELTLEQAPRYVSRGGEKLHGMIASIPFPCTLPRALDIGASTGGFTDCLLQHGVERMVCIDVGRNQLHPKLQSDARVSSIEQYNARHLDPNDLPYPDYPLIVIDVSFISLRTILPPAWKVLQKGGILIALVKPQFEADRATMDRCRGVIRDSTLSLTIAESLRDFALDSLADSRLLQFAPSVIQGTDGNQEYLLAVSKAGPPTSLD
jgi:23S rRNA (cytidine1920-2'-O)/16S rRNA (cytidine1409-2'-O)-methyltransferase